MTFGLNLACLGDQPQKVSCCLLSLVVLLRLVFTASCFKFSLAGLKLVSAEQVEDRRRRLQFFDGVTLRLTSTSIKKALNVQLKTPLKMLKLKLLLKKMSNWIDEIFDGAKSAAVTTHISSCTQAV